MGYNLTEGFTQGFQVPEHDQGYDSVFLKVADEGQKTGRERGESEQVGLGVMRHFSHHCNGELLILSEPSLHSNHIFLNRGSRLPDSVYALKEK